MFLRFNFLGLLWSLFIILLCTTPTDQLPDASLWAFLSFDKAVHFGLFALLTLFVIVGLKRQYSFYQLRYYPRSYAVLYSVLFGLGIEILQLSLSTGRNFDWMDWVADIIGSCLGVILFRIIYGKEFAR